MKLISAMYDKRAEVLVFNLIQYMLITRPV